MPMRKAVRTRWEKSGKRSCAFCHKPIAFGGVKDKNRWYHRVCIKRKKVVEISKKYATKGFYAR